MSFLDWAALVVYMMVAVEMSWRLLGDALRRRRARHAEWWAAFLAAQVAHTEFTVGQGVESVLALPDETGALIRLAGIVVLCLNALVLTIVGVHLWGFWKWRRQKGVETWE